MCCSAAHAINVDVKRFCRQNWACKFLLLQQNEWKMLLGNSMGFGSDIHRSHCWCKTHCQQKLTQPVHSSLVRNTGRIMYFIAYLKKNLHTAWFTKQKGPRQLGRSNHFFTCISPIRDTSSCYWNKREEKEEENVYCAWLVYFQQFSTFLENSVVKTLKRQ